MSSDTSTLSVPLENFKLANTYVIESKIGSGAFGEIYQGCIIHSGIKVAIKVEHALKPRHEQLGHEAKVYRTLNGGSGIPKIYYYGSEGGLNFLVMELLGPSLEQLFNFCSRKFTLKTVLMLADTMVSMACLFLLPGMSMRVVTTDRVPAL